MSRPVSPDREPGWVQDVAAANGWTFSDRSHSSAQVYVLSGHLGAAGGHRPWECVARREYLADGGAEDDVRWECASLRAARPELDTAVAFGGESGAFGATGTWADAVTIGVGLIRARRRRQSQDDRRPPGAVPDVLQSCEIQDPAGLLTAPVRELFEHWPVLDPPKGPVLAGLSRLFGAPELPPDAPPLSLAFGMTSHSPLSVNSRDWWVRGPWLVQQIRLGNALGLAVVAAHAHA